MEPHTPESMATSLYIVQEFMSGSTLKVHMFDTLLSLTLLLSRKPANFKMAEVHFASQTASAICSTSGLC